MKVEFLDVVYMIIRMVVNFKFDRDFNVIMVMLVYVVGWGDVVFEWNGCLINV